MKQYKGHINTPLVIFTHDSTFADIILRAFEALPDCQCQEIGHITANEVVVCAMLAAKDDVYHGIHHSEAVCVQSSFGCHFLLNSECEIIEIGLSQFLKCNIIVRTYAFVVYMINHLKFKLGVKHIFCIKFDVMCVVLRIYLTPLSFTHLFYPVCFITRGQFWPSGIVVACVCVSVSLCVNHLLVRTITQDPFKLGSPNLNQRCKRPWLGSLLFFGAKDLDHHGQI